MQCVHHPLGCDTTCGITLSSNNSIAATVYATVTHVLKENQMTRKHTHVVAFFDQQLKFCECFLLREDFFKIHAKWFKLISIKFLLKIFDNNA